MNIYIALESLPEPSEVRVGNVYAVKGGSGARHGHMQVVIAITDSRPPYECARVLLLTVNKDAKPVGVTHYGLSYFADKMPIAFADGVDAWALTIRSL